jgi:hypothetical protein
LPPRPGSCCAAVEQWLDARVRLVWAVYPGTRSVVAHQPGGVARLLRGDDVLDGGDVLPGFTLALPELFVDD